MSHKIPAPGTTVILRQKQDGPFDWDFNNKPPKYTEVFVVVLRETEREVVCQLKGQPIETYLPRRFFLSKGYDNTGDVPTLSLPAEFEIITLPI